MANYLITGTNRGIGLEYCKQLQAKGETVIAVCREPSEELKALGVPVESGIDVTSDDSVAELVKRLQGTTIDVLINNAGIIEANSLENLDFESLERQFRVNAVAPLRVTKALLPLIPKGGKIVLMTSRMGSIEDNTSGGYYGYRMSKTALSMAGKSLAEDLKPRGIAVGILHPGMVQTRMTDFSGITTQESVQGLIQRIEELNLDNSGTFWHGVKGEVLPW
ncbi:SDR family oxidoreductase [Euhalothece natronophila Z-M001]|uniref:SDR family oxidoreductase n=1 Tax=Euhalothece natronophila Z-M001 TaxID=522448 RepID=A0A5B8NH90_9CHRO|nr:SDR family oxidoreductase [Euhalothece natronophila]QDZ38553.1 SDR family oxidoreductase [Euhalothece natronophila Z-M001]